MRAGLKPAPNSGGGREAIKRANRRRAFLSARRLTIDAFAQGHRRELLVGCFFLVQIGGEQAQDIVVAELLGPRNQGPITGDLVVLDRLCCTDDRGIEDLLVSHLSGDLIGFADEPVDRTTLHSFWRLPELLEYLVEAGDLVLCLIEVIAQPLAEIA